MGNEPWVSQRGQRYNARYLGSLFRVPADRQGGKPQLQPECCSGRRKIFYGTAGNSALVSAAQGRSTHMTTTAMRVLRLEQVCFDKNSDALLEPGTPIEGKRGILGECNIGWTPVQDDWNAGHVRDMGGSMALLNAMLEMIGDGRYSRIVTWLRIIPAKRLFRAVRKTRSAGSTWTSGIWRERPVRLTGPAAAHRIVNQNVLENRLGASSSAEKGAGLRILQCGADRPARDRAEQMGRHTAYAERTGADGLRKRDGAERESVWDTAPEYRSLFAGCEAVTGGSYTGGIPERALCTRSAPARREKRPAAGIAEPGTAPAARGTAQAFAWTPVDGGRNYRLPYRPTQTFPHPRSIHTQAWRAATRPRGSLKRERRITGG